MSSPALRLVPDSDFDAFGKVEPFNPTIHHVTQEAALDVVSELADKRFAIMGSVEQYSGIHKAYGACIILITASSDSIIIPIS